MNYLQLCQRLRQEIRGAGSGPTTVVGQDGLYADLVNWIADAHRDLQTQDNGQWRWLRKEFTLNTVVDQRAYSFGDCTDVEAATAIARFSAWRLNDPYLPPKVYRASAGEGTERYIVYRPWRTFEAIYGIGNQNSGSVAYISENPQQQIVFGPPPNDIYTVTGEFFRGPVELAADTDTPEFPEQYHMILVFKAMMDYGFNEVAPELLDRAERRYYELEARLVMNQSEFMNFRAARPMVE